MAVKRVLTGMRTTGALHLGHYVGALKMWKKIQDEGRYECFFLLADVQALTTHADQPELLEQSVREVVLDWLSVGLNPNLPHVHFVLQSQVPERYELSVLLGMIARYQEVVRNPTLKSELKQQAEATIGFMTYPVDQVADIYMVTPVPPGPQDEVLVPVGRDQVPHLEYARTLARRFNKKYGPVFVSCTPLVGEVGRLVGIDGKAKMSKSLDNAIFLNDYPAVVSDKVRRMFTDPKRVRANIPGDTRKNPVFVYHRAFNPDRGEVRELAHRYRQGQVGDVEVKTKLAMALNGFLCPIRERREQFANTDIHEILKEGTQAARAACAPVVQRVRELMHLRYPAG